MTISIENEFEFVKDQNRILAGFEDIYALMNQTYWANDRDKDTVELSIRNSICYAAIDKASDRIVGFLRVVTDYATVFYLCDVVVDKEYRNKGIGKKLVEWVVKEEMGSPHKYGMLLTRNAQELYKQFGFSEFAGTCMCINK